MALYGSKIAVKRSFCVFCVINHYEVIKRPVWLFLSVLKRFYFWCYSSCSSGSKNLSGVLKPLSSFFPDSVKIILIVLSLSLLLLIFSHSLNRLSKTSKSFGISSPHSYSHFYISIEN